MPDNPFFETLKQKFDSLKTGKDKYGLIIQATEGFIHFVRAARIEEERFALGERDPSAERTEGFIRVERLADLEDALDAALADLPSADSTGQLALDQLQQDDPAAYYKLMRE